MGGEKRFFVAHRCVRRRRGITLLSASRHSHDQRFAISAFGARRSLLYEGFLAPALDAVTFLMWTTYETLREGVKARMDRKEEGSNSNRREAAKGSNEIVQNITGVAQAAQSTASGATQTQTAAQELARLASELQSAVGQFKVDDGKQETKPVAGRSQGVRKKDSGMAPQQPKPSYRPADTTLHAL